MPQRKKPGRQFLLFSQANLTVDIGYPPMDNPGQVTDKDLIRLAKRITGRIRTN